MVKKFNPLEMEESDVLALATGREDLLELMLDEMRSCLEPAYNQHYILHGPRGIGKSFFTRLLKIHHDRSKEFSNSLFIQLPEEQDHINFVSDLMDTISTVLEGGSLADAKPSWTISDAKWHQSRKRLEKALEFILNEKGVSHVFVTQENLQSFIPELDEVESGRMREFLSEFQDVSIIGSSLRPDLDNDYSKKLFQVFKKIDIKPWADDDFLEYYRRKANQSQETDRQLSALSKSKNKIKAIAKFTGGSPRLAVILSDLILNKNILETSILLDGIIDDLTIYYQDLTRDIPYKSKMLFDMLIRQGENITQSELAQSFDPPLEQRMIARSFKWLLDNYYIVYTKLSKGNTKHFYVRDRLYVLYYQKRQIYADQPFSVIDIFVDFLSEYYTQKEWKEQLEGMDTQHDYSGPILHCLAQRQGLRYEFGIATKDLKMLLQVKEPSLADEDDGSKDLCNKAIMSLRTGDLENVRVALNEMEKLTRSYSASAKTYFHLGLLKQELGDNFGALKEYTRVNSLQDSNVNSYYNMGIVKMNVEEYADAITSFEKVLEFDPQNTFAYYNLGISKYSIGDFSGAISALKQANEININGANVNNELEKYKFKTGDYYEENEVFQKTKEYRPELSIVKYSLGKAFMEDGQYAEAFEIFKEVLGLGELKEVAIRGMVSTLLIQGSWSTIPIELRKWMGESKPEQLLGNAFLYVFLENKISDPLYVLNQIFQMSSENDFIELKGLINTIIVGLYLNKGYRMLETFLDEVSEMDSLNPMLNVLFEAVSYLLSPSGKALENLHPDARTVVLTLRTMEEVEKEIVS